MPNNPIGMTDISSSIGDIESSLKSFANLNSETFNKLLSNTKEMSSLLREFPSIDNIGALDKTIGSIQDYSAEFSKIFERLEKIFDSLEDFGESLSISSDSFKRISNKLEMFVDDVRNDPDYQPGKKKKNKTYFERKIANEYKNVTRVVNPHLKKLMLPGIAGAGIFGGILSIVIYGIEEQQKRQATVGLAKNVLIESFDSLNKGLVQSASNWLGQFAYNAEKLIGIPKEEIIGVAKVFMDSGVSIKESIKDMFDQSVGPIGKNLVTYSLALDKMFELSSGTIAGKTVDYMKRYGMASKDATKAITDMLYFGRQLGLGSLEFVNSIEGMQDSLESMGYMIDDVLKVSVTLQERFRVMGVPKFIAERDVVEGLKNISGGLSNMDVTWTTMIAEMMGYGYGMQAYIGFKDNMTRMLQSGDKNLFADEMKKLAVALVDKFGPDKAFYIIESQIGGTGWGAPSARQMLNIYNAVKEGKSLEAIKDSKGFDAFMGQAAQSMGVESQKMTDMQKYFNEWLIEISKIGQQMLAVLMDLLAFMVYGFKALIATFQSLGATEDEKLRVNKAILLKGIELSSKLKRDWSKVDLSNLVEIGKKIGFEALGDSIDAVRTAVDANFSPYPNAPDTSPTPSLSVASAPSSMSSFSSGGGSGGGIGSSSVKSAVPSVPSRKPKKGKSSSYSDDVRESDQYLGAYDPDEYLLEGETVDTDLRIESTGYDPAAKGIKFVLKGSCPSCGQKFGPGHYHDVVKSFEPYKDVTSTLLQQQSGLEDIYTKSEAKAGTKRGKAGSDLGLENVIASASKYSDPVNILTQMLYTEGGVGAVYNNQKALAGKLYTVLNRKKNSPRHKDKSLSDIITAGQGYGPVGYGGREYGTGRPVTPKTSKEWGDTKSFVEKALSGGVDNPVGGATSFFDDTGGKGYNLGDATYAMPHFASDGNLKNVANIGSTRFYGPGKDVSNRGTKDTAMETKFKSQHPDWQQKGKEVYVPPPKK